MGLKMIDLNYSAGKRRGRLMKEELEDDSMEARLSMKDAAQRSTCKQLFKPTIDLATHTRRILKPRLQQVMRPHIDASVGETATKVATRSSMPAPQWTEPVPDFRRGPSIDEFLQSTASLDEAAMSDTETSSSSCSAGWPVVLHILESCETAIPQSSHKPGTVLVTSILS